MPVLYLTTKINAPVDICFNLARSIDLHLESMQHTREKAIAGKTSGLINLHETVTWRARHFGFMLELTSKITELEPYSVFSDEMVKGPFKMMRHKHLFHQQAGNTEMVDEFEFESPFGILGRIANYLFLTKYMENLMAERNRVIKEKAELQHNSKQARYEN